MAANNIQLMRAWQTWIRQSPSRRRHYFDFYTNVVQLDPQLSDHTLDQVIDILAAYDPVKPIPATRGPTHRTSTLGDQQNKTA